jgi:pimeloyl-ACP methyl ester carboxylesterase
MAPADGSPGCADDPSDPMTSPRLVPVNDVELEVRDWGTGEPVILIQTALTADELLPLATRPVLRDGYRKVVYHRRGYAGSSPVNGRGSIPRDAADCRALLDALAIERAHILGISYSGAVALQLAADAPEQVHTLILIEPPPTHVASAPEFRAANERLIEARREQGPEAALDEFLTTVIGPNYREPVERHLPGAMQQIERDVLTFFDTDLPALLDWQFGTDDAQRITCPVLHIGGSDSGAFFGQVRELMLDWLPQAEDVVIAGADHGSLPLTHVAAVADAVMSFLRRHPT